MKAGIFLGMAIIASVVIAVSFALSSSSSKNKNIAKAPHFQVKVASSITKGERRKEERQSNARMLCERCQRPPAICVCQALPAPNNNTNPNQKLSTQTTVLVLQHPNEFRKKTFSTVPLMSLVLENMQVKRDYKFELDDLPLVQEYLDKGQKPLLLFPSDDAISLDENDDDDDDSVLEESDGTKNVHRIQRIKENENLLIVFDGTWAEAKRMALASPRLLEVCEPVQFQSPAVCLYDAVRKEPHTYCLSTLEACAQALVLLEGANDVANSLNNVLQLMVDIQLNMERHRHDDPRRLKGKQQLYERNRRRRQVERTLFEKTQPKILEDGAVLRPLTSSDAPFLASNWYHPSKSSLRTMEQCLEHGLASFGIEKDGTLCAGIVRLQDGTLGMLFVDEVCRRKGYGTALVKEATRVLQELDRPCVSFIKTGNVAAEACFRSAGWVVVDQSAHSLANQNMKRRKWILEASSVDS